MKLILCTLALLLSALTLWAQELPDATAYDLKMTLSKLNSTQLDLATDNVPNGLTTHRLVFWGPEATRSLHIVPLNTTTPYLNGTRKMGTLTFTGGSGGGGGGKHEHRPTGGNEVVDQWIEEANGGIRYLKTITKNWDGSITMDMVPEANGVLSEQTPDNPMNEAQGELFLKVTEQGGAYDGNWSGYRSYVPFMNVNSNVSVTHFADSNTYAVSSFHITIGGATLSCSGGTGGRLKITIDWFKQSKEG